MLITSGRPRSGSKRSIVSGSPPFKRFASAWLIM